MICKSLEMKWICKAVKGMIYGMLGCIALWGIWGMMRIFLLDTFIIPSESMLPTLKSGDKIIVDKTLYGARIYRNFHFDKKGIDLKCFRTNGRRHIKRNDVVVFNVPVNDNQIKFIINYVYCKRCIGLPGDSVSIVNGFYKNNNFLGVLGNERMQQELSQLPDTFFHSDVFTTPPYDKHLKQWTIKNFGPLYIPRKGECMVITPQTACYYRTLLEWELGAKLQISHDFKHVYADGHEIKEHYFLHDYYFMAGDHVKDSRDSRYWGLVPDDYIIGIVTRIEYSKDKNTGKWQWDRFLKKVD